MTSDELGEKGESKFKELCADAGLICNKSDRDRAGWDFVVDFPEDEKSEKSYDNRLGALSCIVQQKTILSTSKSIKMKLNMAERLAKEIKPSFVCVFKVNQNKEFTDAFLIHISDNRLKAILKKLREEQVKDDGIALNKKTISFTPSKAERIEVSGAALKQKIEQICGLDLHQYSNNKKNQLEQLGFEQDRYIGKIRFKAESEEDFLDILSGKKEAEFTHFETNEKRFGILMPDYKSHSGSLTFTPNPLSKCTLSIRRNELDEPIIFHCDLLATPLLSDDSPIRYIIKNELFSLHRDLIRKEGGGESENSFSFETSIDDRKCTANTWADLWGMLNILKNGGGLLEIKPENKGQLLAGALPPITQAEGSEIEDIIAYADMSARLSEIIKRTGVLPNPTFSFDDIYDNAEQIYLLSELLSGATPKNQILDNEQLANYQMHPRIFAGHLAINTILIGFYATALVAFADAGKSQYITEFKLQKIQECVDKDGFKSFIENAAIKHQITELQYVKVRKD